MKVLGVVYLLSVIYYTFIGNLKINGKVDTNIIHKFIASLFISIIITVVLGLPVLGIISLIR